MKGPSDWVVIADGLDARDGSGCAAERVQEAEAALQRLALGSLLQARLVQGLARGGWLRGRRSRRLCRAAAESMLKSNGCFALVEAGRWPAEEALGDLWDLLGPEAEPGEEEGGEEVPGEAEGV